MTLRDIAFWIRSARADAALERLRSKLGLEGAFDKLYGTRPDPFGAALPQYRYQRQKYERMISMLPGRRYHDVLDIGCGLGVLARQLAPFGDTVLGLDISRNAVTEARERSLSFDNLEFAHADVMDFDARERRFDLIVLADTLYYLSPLSDDRLKTIAAKMQDLLAPGGVLLLVNHFFFTVDPASRMTRHIHNSFRWAAGLNQIAEHKRAFFLATLLEKSSLEAPAAL
ncbi:MAG TPA: class I SAM-dependent methyltransferase [Stellaceae bacterium]|nr:class I SAM-dependent methyltransferase [Stellaceae bacterium]